MDINVAIQILSVIAQAYATILSIISGFFIFFVEYYKRKEKEKEPIVVKQLGLIRFVETNRSFTTFFVISIFEVFISLMTMWFIGVSAFTSEILTYVILAFIVFAMVGFLILFYLVMKIIEEITKVFVL